MMPRVVSAVELVLGEKRESSSVQRKRGLWQVAACVSEEGFEHGTYLNKDS